MSEQLTLCQPIVIVVDTILRIVSEQLALCQPIVITHVAVQGIVSENILHQPVVYPKDSS